MCLALPLFLLLTLSPPRLLFSLRTEPSTSRAQIEAAFAVFDTDGDGTLSPAELKAILTRSGPSRPSLLTEAEVDELVERFDTNGDGVLSVEEFARAFSSLTQHKALLEMTDPMGPAQMVQLDIARQEVARLQARNRELEIAHREDAKTIAQLRARVHELEATVDNRSGGVIDTSPTAAATMDGEEASNARVQVARENEEGSCTFYFVDADALRRMTDRVSLPPFQELHAREPQLLVQRKLSQHAAFRASYVGELCAVSHRWEDSSAPDTKGVQLRTIIEHLQDNPSIKLVWYDHWCMPQGKRTVSDTVLFKWMLGSVNMLYLGCSVLVLLDISYLSRFWTQFEARAMSS